MLRVLVVDDEESVRDLLITRLERWGHRVTAAPDGESALRAYRHLRPDLVLMDLEMPRCNGLDASRAIREEDPGASIILITASPDAPAARKALEMGYVQVAIPKPFYFEQLRMAMREAVGRPGAQPASKDREAGVA